MKKSTILLILIIILLFISSFATFFYFTCVKNNTENYLAKSENLNKSLNIIPIDSSISKEQIILSKTSQGLYSTNNMKNNTFIAEDAEVILIGTIKSIEGVINYNPTSENYVMTRTIGTIEVDNVIKGDLVKSEIPFMKLGGVIPINEYEKGIPIEQAEKFGFNKMSNEEKQSKYVSEQLENDINIEQGETYLIYLKYYDDYDIYSICYLQYGIRQVKIDNKFSSNSIKNISNNEYKHIMVMNNENGTYESLDSILPASLTNSYMNK